MKKVVLNSIFFTCLFFALISCQGLPVNLNSGSEPNDTNQKEDTVKINNDYPELKAVDLGLSVKWSNKNLWVRNLSTIGDYYSWGEVETKESYTWESYKWCSKAEYLIQTSEYLLSFSKYNTSSAFGEKDNETTLKPEDDVAHLKLGGKWRIPTKQEWEELLNSCTWEHNFHGEGVNEGWDIKSKINGEMIFISYFMGNKQGTSFDMIGHQSYFWSSDLDTENPANSWAFVVNNPDLPPYENFLCSLERFRGMNIRPVMDY